MNGEIQTAVSNTYPRLPYYDPDLIPAFGARYVTQEVKLGVTISNPHAIALTVVVSGRVLTRDGRVTENRDVFAVAGTPPLITLRVPLPEGYLLAASVVVTAGNVIHGAAYATMALLYGSGASESVSEVLASGYLSTIGGLSYPYGRNEQPGEGRPNIVGVGPISPAAGVNASFAPPTQSVIRLTMVQVQLTTDAVAANRTMQLNLPSPGGGQVFQLQTPAVQGPNLNNVYLFYIGATFAVVGTRQYIPLPDGILFPNGASISTLVIGLDVGDTVQISTLMYEEWVQN